MRRMERFAWMGVVLALVLLGAAEAPLRTNVIIVPEDANGVAVLTIQTESGQVIARLKPSGASGGLIEISKGEGERQELTRISGGLVELQNGARCVAAMRPTELQLRRSVQRDGQWQSRTAIALLTWLRTDEGGRETVEGDIRVQGGDPTSFVRLKFLPGAIPSIDLREGQTRARAELAAPAIEAAIAAGATGPAEEEAVSP